jgi:hypothetical protein
MSHIFNPNSNSRSLPTGSKPALRRLSEHLSGVKPRRLPRNHFVQLQVDTRPRLTRAVLVRGLFLAAVPARCIPASTYLKDLYNWWRYGSSENDSQQISAHATLDSLARQIRQTSRLASA